MKVIKRKLFSGLVFFLLILLCSLLGGSLWLGSKLIAPAPRAMPKDILEPLFQEVSFKSATGRTIDAWLIPPATNQALILLLHGNRGFRLDMLSRAKFLIKAGYGVLLMDFQAHGQSPGEHLSFGKLESQDVLGAMGFINKTFPNIKIGVIGTSLGGAAALILEEQLKADALVVEAAYSTLDKALENRLNRRLGVLGLVLKPLLTVQVKPRLGFDIKELEPIRSIKKIKCPVFVIGGSKDENTLLEETKALYQAAPQPKELWIVNGAGHVNFHRFEKDAYERKVLEFFDHWL